ncbi:metalloprotease family protein [Natrinema zhouii]|uniref:metalloprotease family protein n=1 Tax=Natrinema zhouii TaxID=1710539 RepID=UPI001CF79A9B|nr:metalloprotease family protein [Natrinema zhouii]QLK27728.2 metalloprotease family protein [Natrinema zhouii]
MNAEYVTYAVAIAVAVAVLVAVLVGITVLARFLFRLFTVPGVVVHEFAHKQACDLVGVPVLEVAYFRFGDPPGYVQHVTPDRYRASFVVSVAPFLVNTIVAFAAFLGLATLVSTTGDIRAASSETIAAAAVLGWLGLSIGMHAFPSRGDANVLWNRSRTEWRGSPRVLLGVPIVVVIYIANLLSWLWADVLYAIGLFVLAAWIVGFGVA